MEKAGIYFLSSCLAKLKYVLFLKTYLIWYKFCLKYDWCMNKALAIELTVS